MTSLNESLNENRLNSYEKFEQRLKTFKIFKWFGKSDSFSPIECAKHGWINLSKDTLKCLACSNLFYYYTKSPNSFRVHLNSDLDDETAAQGPQVLKEKHNTNCPWRTLIIQDSLIHIDVYNEEKAFENFMIKKQSFQKCQELPYLVACIFEKFPNSMDSVENSTTSLAQNIALNMRQKEKLNTINILAACGWIYKQDKNVLNCEKCFRSAGLWMYKSRDVEDIEDSDQVDQELDVDDQNMSSISDIFVFNSTDPYSDELAVRSCVSNIINIIEVEEQALLVRNSSFSELSADTHTYENYSSKKRKIDQISDAPRASFSTNSRSVEVESSKKIFDPITEHFSWCPWVKENKQINKLICQINFEIACKFMSKKNQKQSDPNSFNLPDMNSYMMNRSKSASDDVIVNSQILLDKVKAAQSVLINCTSQFSLKC